jgi:hypothetical protein
MTEWLSWVWWSHSISVLCNLQISWWYNPEDHILQRDSCCEIHLVTELVNYYLLMFCMNEVHVLCHVRSERMWLEKLCVLLSFAVKTGSFVYDVNIGLDNWQPSQVRIRESARTRGCMCVCVGGGSAQATHSGIGLARIRSSFLQFFWEPVNVENEAKWRVFSTLYIRFQNCN